MRPGEEPVFAAIGHGVVCVGFYCGPGYTVTPGCGGERIRGTFSWG